VSRLRNVVFPNGGRWEKDNRVISRIKDVIQAACEDPAAIGE
jgi:hypothetical protein